MGSSSIKYRFDREGEANSSSVEREKQVGEQIWQMYCWEGEGGRREEPRLKGDGEKKGWLVR